LDLDSYHQCTYSDKQLPSFKQNFVISNLFMRLTTRFYYNKAGLLKLWVAPLFGVAKCNFGVAKKIGLANQI